MWECKQLGAYSPLILLNTLVYFCYKHFGLATAEQHRQLSFAHVMCCTKTNADRTKTTYVRFYPPLTAKSAESGGRRRVNSLSLRCRAVPFHHPSDFIRHIQMESLRRSVKSASRRRSWRCRRTKRTLFSAQSSSTSSTSASGAFSCIF